MAVTVRSGCRNDSDGNDCHDHGTAVIVRAMTDMNMVDWFFDKLLIMTRQRAQKKWLDDDDTQKLMPITFLNSTFPKCSTAHKTQKILEQTKIYKKNNKTATHTLRRKSSYVQLSMER